MKTIDFVPSCTKDKPAQGDQPEQKAKFTGVIKLKAPDFDERYQWVEEFAEAGQAAASQGALAQLPLLRRAVVKSRPYYQDVNLTRLSDGVVFKSFEALSEDPDCDEILIEVAGFFLGGSRGGK